MHSFTKIVDGIRYHVHHNGDWSDETIIAYSDRDGQHEVRLPGGLLIACGRQAAFNEVIAAVEQME
jgi:hypothetical protein